MNISKIQITKSDHEKLERLIVALAPATGRLPDHLQRLQTELARAEVKESLQMDPNTVTLHSRVRIHHQSSGEKLEFTLVCPDRANADEGRISILAPLGTAILGCKLGDSFEWPAPTGVSRASIEKIIFQPEQVMRGYAGSESTNL